MRLKHLITGGLLALTMTASAQTLAGFTRVDTVDIYDNSQPLLFPWAGGLNFCQFSDIDLNQDGIMDLFVFDRTGNKITTYLNQGTPGQVDYVLAPQYVSLFPPLHDWAILRDYNCDGKMDIFTCSIAGFAIYKNTSTLSSGIQFQLMTNLVLTDRSPNSSHFMGNLFVSQVDIPAVRDVDGDGDLDVLTFQNGGNQVEYHKNLSMDLYGVCDSIKYAVSTNCWGEFTENAVNSSIAMNTTCPAVPVIDPVQEFSTQHSLLHSGSCLECINVDNDNDQDLVLGDISNPMISYLRNGGTNTFAQIDAVDDSFPEYDVPLNVDVFSCGFHLDVNNDGKKDLLFSPSALNASENFKSCWYYKNVGTNTDVSVTYVQNNFLQDSMIDVGEGAYPVFFDYDNDGDSDLLVGNFGYYNASGPYISKIALLKNTGTATNPSFTYITNDFANLHANYPTLLGMASTFGDVDGDGDRDMIIGLANGQLAYFQKQPGPADNFVLVNAFYQSIDVGNNAAPQLVDVDRDGLLDLLIGEQSGNLNYYRNTGTSTSPVFTQVSSTFGNVIVNQIGYSTGYTVPCLFNNGGSYVLIVGSERGWLNRYDNIDGNLSGSFTRTDSNYVSIYEGGRVAPTIGDLNGDGLYDVVIGNYSGGISLFYGDNNVSTGQVYAPEFASFSLFPNPANEMVTIETDKSFSGKETLVIRDLSGKEILSSSITSQQTFLRTDNFPAGIYICTMTDENGFSVNQKLVISR